MSKKWEDRFLDWIDSFFEPWSWPKPLRRAFLVTLPLSVVIWLVLFVIFGLLLSIAFVVVLPLTVLIRQLITGEPRP